MANVGQSATPMYDKILKLQGNYICVNPSADTHDVRGAGDLQRERQREGEGEEALEGDHQGEERHHWRLEGELE